MDSIAMAKAAPISDCAPFPGSRKPLLSNSNSTRISILDSSVSNLRSVAIARRFPTMRLEKSAGKFLSPLLAYRVLGSSNVSSSFFGDPRMARIILGVTLQPFSHFGRKGGVISSEMNVFQRIFRILQSYVNSFVSMFEDPEKILDQTVIEMNDDLVRMRQATAQVVASQRMIENKCNQSQRNSDEWYKRAKLALEKGDEVLAREALKRRKSYEDNALSLRSQLKQQDEVVDKLVSSTRVLEAKISEAKSKKDILIARAQSARTSLKVNEMIGNVSTSNALAAFEKMEEKVMALEAESDALGQLSSDELVNKFALLEGDSVESDLADLRREMLSSSKQLKILPSGRAIKDIEIEMELNDLRKKAREY